MPDTYGRLAFITTPEFRDKRPREVADFVYRQLYSLCSHFEVLSTGRTYGFVERILALPFSEVDRAAIAEGTGFSIEGDEDLARWRKTIRQSLRPMGSSIKGMIEVTFELVEGRLNGIIHLTDAADVSGKRDSMVLRREANVHGAFIASDVYTARAAVASWLSQIAKNPGCSLFPKKPQTDLPLKNISEASRVLALIAHDGMKLEMCRFVVENVRPIFNNHDFILATGTTGGWIKKFAIAAGRDPAEVDEKVRLCRSGPYGGDVQIAAAVLKRLCKRVIFLQDPFTSHAHETDIRLFEQALFFERAALTGDIEVALATNVETARILIDAPPIPGGRADG